MSKNIFSDLFSKLNLKNRKVQLGFVIVIALLGVAIAIGGGIEKKNKHHERDEYVSEDEDTAPEEESVGILDNNSSEKPEKPGKEKIANEVNDNNLQEAPEETEEEAEVKEEKTSYNSSELNPGSRPQFPGGEAAMNEYIWTCLQYPYDALQAGAQGRVLVQFTVTRTGNIANVHIVSGKHPSLNREALRIVRSMPKWTPGRVNGKPVDVTLTLPINFQLQ